MKKWLFFPAERLVNQVSKGKLTIDYDFQHVYQSRRKPL